MEIRVIGRDIQIDVTETIAVENDHATETACFILDRYTDSGIDLWSMNGFIVYQNDLGTRFEVLDMALVGDKIQAKWIVTRTLTTINGRFLFGLTFLSSASYDDLPGAEKVWSTNIAKSNITGSLVGDDYAVPEEPIILKMLEIAAGAAESGKQALQYMGEAKAEADRAVGAAAAVAETAQQINAKFDTIEALIAQITDTVDQINGEVV